MYVSCSGGISPRRLAMHKSASGEHDVVVVDCDAEVDDDDDDDDADFNSSNMALAWTNAVGSTGSLISSCTSWGVRRVSIVIVVVATVGG